MGLFIVGTIYGVFYGIDKFTHHGEAISVPNVKGMSVAEAQSTFLRYGLACSVVDSVYMRTELPGTVVDYTPSAGQRVKQGRNIYLTINTSNVPLRPIPDVADNSSVRQAHAKLLAVDFKLAKDEYVSGQKDWVYNVKFKGEIMPAGAMVPLGATLTLLVGDGSEIVNDSIDLDLDSLDFSTPMPDEFTEENSWFQ